jgi:hypothetical protein
MILYRGNRNKLTQLSWHCLHITSTQLTEVLRSLVRALKKATDDIEVFVPPADHSSEEHYVFARSQNPQTIQRLTSVRGIQGFACQERLVFDGSKGSEPTIVRTPIRVPDSEVQAMLAKARLAHSEQAQQIRQGSFVRIRDGQARNYCGHVTKLNSKRAIVTISLPTRTLTVDTSRGNLLDLSQVPEARQLYFYSEAIERMLTEEPEALLSRMPD